MIRASVTWINPVVSQVENIEGTGFLVVYSRPVADVALDVRGLHFRKSEYFWVHDAQAILTSKGLEDSFSLVDSSDRTVDKGITDPLKIQDLFNRVCSFQRQFADPLVLRDAASKSLGKPFAEGVKVVDSARVSASKGINEGVSFRDSVFTKTGSLNKADPLRVRDSFLLSLNGYCDMSYFAGDYVGTSRTV